MSENIAILNDYDVCGTRVEFLKKMKDLYFDAKLLIRRHNLDWNSEMIHFTRQVLNADVSDKIFILDSEQKFELLKQRFWDIFSSLKSVPELAEDKLSMYFKEMSWDQGLMSDYFSYFSAFLRTQKVNPDIYKNAEWDWHLHSLNYLDFGTVAAADYIQKNPGLVFLPKKVSSASEELICLYFDTKTQAVEQLRMSPEHSVVLDALDEGMKFTEQKLLDFLMLDGYSSEVIQKAILDLRERRILV